MKRFIHNILVKILLSDGGLEEKYINQKTKRIHFGLYSIQKMFFEPHHNLACMLLQKWFKYTFWEEQIRFTSTWCNAGDINEDFKIFNQRVNEEKEQVVKRHINTQ